MILVMEGIQNALETGVVKVKNLTKGTEFEAVVELTERKLKLLRLAVVEKIIRLSGIAYESLVNGPGMEKSIFRKAVSITVMVALIRIPMIFVVEKKEI